MTDIQNDSFDTADRLDEELTRNKSRLKGLQSQMLSDGYEVTNTPRYQDNLIYLF